MVIVMMLRMVLYAPIIAVGGVYKVINTNVSMTWIIALGVVLILALVLVLFLCVMPKFRILQKMVDRVNLVTREILTGLSVIRAFHTEKHEEERFDVANRDLTKTNLFVNRAMTFMMPAMMLIMNGISILICDLAMILTNRLYLTQKSRLCVQATLASGKRWIWTCRWQN